RASRSLAAGRSALRARARRLPLVRVARLGQDEAPVVCRDCPGEARGRKEAAMIPRRSPVLVALLAAFVVVSTSAAEGAWLPKRKLSLTRTLTADRVAPTKPRALTVV